MPLTKLKGPIRVVVVDDSATARDLIVALLQQEEGILVQGVGACGEDAVRLVKRLKPDVLAMDVQMPGLDGLEATRQIMRDCPLPIILVTSSLMPGDVELTFRALKAGALTVAKKPGLADPETCASLVETIRLMAGLPVVHHWGREAPTRPVVKPGPLPGPAFEDLQSRLQVIGMAASTGGPGALATILGGLPADFPWPILVVQHVTPGFGLALAEWLGTQTKLQVRLAEHGDLPQPGRVLMAPDDYHMQVNSKGVVELYKGQPYQGLRPSANYLFHSLAKFYGARALGIMLTGMGNDGVEGLEALYRAGGLTLAQDEESCVVYGMPREAIQHGVVSQVLAPEAMTALLLHLREQVQLKQQRLPEQKKARPNQREGQGE